MNPVNSFEIPVASAAGARIYATVENIDATRELAIQA